MKYSDDFQLPWYKQFWPWFLILLPGSVVVASFVTLFIFMDNAVVMVNDDYYKHGKIVSIDLSRQNKAKQLNLNATLTYEGSILIIELDKGVLEDFVPLTVALNHRTLANRDYQFQASSDASGVYRIQSNVDLNGLWQVKISPPHQDWLLQGKVNFPALAPVKLNK